MSKGLSSDYVVEEKQKPTYAHLRLITCIAKCRIQKAQSAAPPAMVAKMCWLTGSTFSVALEPM